MSDFLSGYPSTASNLPLGSPVNHGQKPSAESSPGILGLLTWVFNLLFIATTEPRGRTYHRLIVLGWLLALLLALGCVLGVVWRIEWPQLPELPIPVIMF